MSNKPKNVVAHEHFFVHTPKEMSADESLEIKRYDACLLADGTAGVWCVEEDVWRACRDYPHAQEIAEGLALYDRAKLISGFRWR